MINSPVIASLAEHMMVCAGAAVKNDFLPLDRHVIPLYHTLERRMTKLRIGSPRAKFDFGKKSSGSVNIALFRFS